ncbi:MAG: hypothetical protein JWR69_1295 [Pedosphaera sp.]|nr:hypothetical protein [Pedosphaera sp.]
MSLINEALKKAKRTQPAASSAEGPALRPAETTRHADEGPGLFLPILIGAVLVLACFLLWQWFHAGAAAQVRARSRTVAENPAPVVIPSAPSPVTAPPTVPVTTVTPQKSENHVSTNEVAAGSDEPAVTNAVAAPEPKPQAPTYKLQSIFYRPKSPSAVINGKTLFIGDRVGSARLVSIERDSAALVTSTGQTNLLELP